jgi:hypothetical protein
MLAQPGVLIQGRQSVWHKPGHAVTSHACAFACGILAARKPLGSLQQCLDRERALKRELQKNAELLQFYERLLQQQAYVMIRYLLDVLRSHYMVRV